jgi:hypothetical protein
MEGEAAYTDKGYLELTPQEQNALCSYEKRI